jgi:hypothetical protein
MTHIQALREAGYMTSGDRVVAYTDGSCLHNGRAGARGGIGVSWGNERDVSAPLEGAVQTNQRAELEVSDMSEVTDAGRAPRRARPPRPCGARGPHGLAVRHELYVWCGRG